MNLLQLVLTALAVGAASGANILAVFPHTGKSHFFMFEPFIRRLASRGHMITLISHYPVTEPTKNVNFISLAGTIDKLLFNSLSLSNSTFLSSYSKLMALEVLNQWAQRSCETGLSHPPVQELIRSRPSFDLILVEFFNTDCFSILSSIFETPFVGIFSSVLMPWHYDRFGNPDNPSYIVNHFTNFPSSMNLYQRTINTISAFATKFYYRLFFNRPVDDIIRRKLGDGLPPVAEVVKNASLFLVNSHFSLFQARPLVPGIIEVGGMHVSPGKKLPKHLEDFLTASKDGVIVFSMGSTVLGDSIPEDKRRAIAGAFAKLSQNVIWKWESEFMADKPKNVLLQKWIPQNDLLAHPKVKLFVTHSGLMGTEEAVYHGVPMVMIPLFGDQPINAASCEEKGLGIVIDYTTITEESFLKSLRTVLNDKRYAERSDYVSRTFRDRPVPIMDNAVYWVEYVIRYKGAPHLRTAAVHLPWYSEYLLDVAAVFLAVLFAAIYLVAFMTRKLIRTEKSKRD